MEDSEALFFCVKNLSVKISDLFVNN